jgi:hypothetical protein
MTDSPTASRASSDISRPATDPPAAAAAAACHGAWARVTLDQFRHFAHRTLYGYVVFTDISPESRVLESCTTRLPLHGRGSQIEHAHL